MNIRFCEFCSTVLRDEPSHCNVCGAKLIQEVSEEQFNDPGNPWPFKPVDVLCLRIQGQPHLIRFSGTHSVYHLWFQLHNAYENMELYCLPKKQEMELVHFPAGQQPDEYKILDPGILLNCKYRKFSFYAFQADDPEMIPEEGEPEPSYQGSFEMEDCPPKLWGNVLGWLAATAPLPAPENGWTYEI